MVEQPTICTVVAKNYVPFARVLASSFRKHHPDGRCYVLITDDIEGRIDPSSEPFELVTIADLGIPDAPAFCFKYNVTELATAVKPYLFEHLMGRAPANPLVFLDPDIYIVNPLHALFDEFTSGDILLTPHTEKDFPDDGLRPSDRSILTHGLFNLGFIGFKDQPSTAEFIAWWKQKVYNHCVNNPEIGYFVDQRFIDLASVFFRNTRVLYHPGYNVGWWNLHCRTVTSGDSGWECNGAPLYFYHFSGFDPDAPGQISKHQTRFTLDRLGPLTALFAEYRDHLLAAGYHDARSWRYGFDFFTAGGRVTPFVRRIYRDHPELQAKYATPFDSALLRYLARSTQIARTVRGSLQTGARLTVGRAQRRLAI